jgi:iron complex outermembrane receptor protein
MRSYRIVLVAQDGRWSFAESGQTISGAAVVSARLGLDWGRGEFYVFGENLLDQKYTTLNQPFTFPPTVFGVSYARGFVGLGASARF